MQLDLEIESLLVIILAFAAFAILGRICERRANFIWPHDAYTMEIAVVFTAVICIGYTIPEIGNSIPWTLIIIGIASYLIGFIAAGFHRYLHLLDIHDDLHIKMPYIVPYKLGNDWYIQRQTLKESLKNQIWPESRSKVNTNGDLRATSDFTSWHPFFPIPTMDYLPVEKYEQDRFEYITTAHGIRLKKYVPLIVVAQAGMAKKTDVMLNLQAHEEEHIINMRLQSECTRAYVMSGRRAVVETTHTVTKALSESAPHAQLLEIARMNTKEETKIPENIKKKMFGGWRNRGGNS
jgi:hypothetical protein